MAVGRGAPLFVLKVATAAQRDIDSIVDVQELREDQVLLGRLLEDRFGQREGDRYVESIGVQIIGEYRRDRPKRDVWRVKFWDLENRGQGYRVMYMYIPRCRWFIVLAVIPRDNQTYDLSHPVSARIRSDYDRFMDKYG
jgi:hypothetical protein